MGLLRRTALIAALAGLASAQTQQPAQEHVFRVDVQLVRLLATVNDRNGQPVGGLEKGDFEIFDNGVKQEIALFERHTAQPLSVAILLDISGSTAGEMKYQTDAVTRFVKALFGEGNPDDSAALYTFNWEITRAVDYTRNAGRFADRMKRLKAEAGTSLYDAILLASEDIADRPGRHVLVVVTDGGDTVSASNYQRAMRAAHSADAVLYPILTIPIKSEAGRNVGGENALTHHVTVHRRQAVRTRHQRHRPGIQRHSSRLADTVSDRLLPKSGATFEGPVPQDHGQASPSRIAGSDAHWLLW